MAERLANVLGAGRAIFTLAIVALGVETLVCARRAVFLYPEPPNPRFMVIPVLPFLPAIPALAYVFGTVLAACSFGVLMNRIRLPAAMAVGGLFFLSTLVLEVPKYAAIPDSISLRTVVFEPLAIACLLALSLMVFGIDHFLALAPIGTLIPNWIPWHMFWIAFFGAGFIAAGAGIGLNILLRWGAAGIGLMFAIWVFTLHMPRTFLGLYGGHPRSPDEWSSLFIAIALWGGSWALAHVAEAPVPSITVCDERKP